jgi:murein DD-endopeptidase MepM/ murein hydrolase activator NlpD
MQKADILAQPPRRSSLARPLAFAAALLLVPPLAVLTAFGISPPGTDQTPSILVRQPLELPDPPAVDMASERFLSQERVLRGDTVAELFERLGIEDPRAMDFLRTNKAGQTLFRQLVPGRTLQAETGDDGRLLALRYFLNTSSLLEVQRSGEGGFAARQRAITEPPRLVYKTATIRSSLFAATDAADIPDAIAMQVARVFATDIDFHADLRRGDRFSIVYEMIYESGELVAPGRIVAAEFVNDGRAYHAVLFRDDDGGDAYYSLDGSSRAKAFLRSPVEFSRVSSGFGGRTHPIFKNWRAHTGVDFAAPRGTRVIASADGYVVAAGTRGGYGNAVEIRHGGGVTTLYAHLSGFAKGIRGGTRVRQGDPIGYVGSTGFATGPHLHYEFKLSGVHQDPMRVALPKAEPVPASLAPQFRAVAADARSAIERLGSASAARFE